MFLGFLYTSGGGVWWIKKRKTTLSATLAKKGEGGYNAEII
jgi:hypothetical protein